MRIIQKYIKYEQENIIIVWGVERSGFSMVRAKTAKVVCL